MEFPQQQTVAGRQLPEDFVLRGSTLARNHFPLHFFNDPNPSTKKRTEERPDYIVYRAKRIWHLTYKLASVSWTCYTAFSTFVDHSQASRYLKYDHLRFDSDEMSPLYENRCLTVSLLQMRLRQSLTEC
jgi:hypothetical protein